MPDGDKYTRRDIDEKGYQFFSGGYSYFFPDFTVDHKGEQKGQYGDIGKNETREG